jgi:hypothetical protein
MSAEAVGLSIAQAQNANVLQAAGDSGLLALVLIAGDFHIAAQPRQLRHVLGIGAEAASAEDLTWAARRRADPANPMGGEAHCLCQDVLPGRDAGGCRVKLNTVREQDHDRARPGDPHR